MSLVLRDNIISDRLYKSNKLIPDGILLIGPELGYMGWVGCSAGMVRNGLHMRVSLPQHRSYMPIVPGHPVIRDSQSGYSQLTLAVEQL